ncbi:hypothetical protein D3C73_1371720 [compost metagenome]
MADYQRHLGDRRDKIAVTERLIVLLLNEVHRVGQPVEENQHQHRHSIVAQPGHIARFTLLLCGISSCKQIAVSMLIHDRLVIPSRHIHGLVAVTESGEGQCCDVHLIDVLVLAVDGYRALLLGINPFR